jgi:hypothetical protein
VDDGHLTLVDDMKAIPMAVWATHPFSRTLLVGGNDLGTDRSAVPRET